MSPLRLVSTSLEVFAGSEDRNGIQAHAISTDHPYIDASAEQRQTAAAASCTIGKTFVLIVTPYTDQPVLELRVFPDNNSEHKSTAHQLIFPAPLLESIHLSASQGSTLLLQVCTQSGTVYRIQVPLDLLPSVDDIPSRWISEHKLSNLPGDPREIARQGILSNIHTTQDGIISLISCIDGRVIKVIWEQDHASSEKLSGSWQESILRSDNFFSRIFGRSTATISPSQALATSTYSRSNQWKHTLGFTISRDRKLRVWDLGSDACIRIVDLPLSLDTLERGQLEKSVAQDAQQSAEENAGGLQFAARPMLSTFADDENLFLLVYIPAPLPSGNFLACYQVHFEGASLHANQAGTASVGHIELIWEKACDIETRQWMAEGRDLAVVQDSARKTWTIWGLWCVEGEPLLKHLEAFQDGNEWSTVSAPQSYLPLHGVALEEELKSVSKVEDLAQVFMSRLIQPERFSRSTLEEALNEYQDLLVEREGKVPDLASASTTSSIREQIVATVGCTIELEEDSSTGALLHDAHWNALRKEWSTFVSLVEERESMARWPIGLLDGESISQMPFVASRGRVAIPVIESMSSSKLRQLQMRTKSPSRDLDVLLFASKLASTMHPTIVQSFEKELLHALETQSSTPAEDIAENIWASTIQTSLDLDESLEEDFVLLGSEEVKEGIANVLSLLQESPIPSSGKQRPLNSPSELVIALCSDAITQMASDQLQLARWILLLSIAIYVGYMPLDEDSLIGTPSMSDLVAESIALYHRLYSFDVLVRTDGAIESIESETRLMDGDDDDANAVAQEMENMQFGIKAKENLGTTPSNLVHACLLRHQLGEMTQLPSRKSISQRIYDYSTTSLHQLLYPKGSQLQPITLTPSLALFASALIKSGYPSAASTFVGLFPRTPSSHFILARYSLLHNEVEAAASEFEQVVPAFSRLHEEQTEYGSGVLSLISPSIREATTNAEARFHYYRMVTAYFQNQGSHSNFFIAHFAKKAIDSASMLDSLPNLRSLNQSRFTSLLALEWFEDAYVHLINIINLEEQRSLIPDLISRMCEQGQVELLLSFNFASLQVEVVSTLSFKARNSKTIEEVDFYFDLLYAFYIKRGDLKNAGATMWQMGTRLRQMAQSIQQVRGDQIDEEFIRQLCVMEARAYLASINVLSQLDLRDAWFAHDTGGAKEEDAMQSKLTRYVPASAINAIKTRDTLQIINLKDIRRRYQIRLAQLEVYSSRSSQYSSTILTTDRNDANTVISLLISNEDYERAFTLSRLLDIDRTPVYMALTDRCLELGRIEQGRKNQSSLSTHPLISALLDDQDGASGDGAEGMLRSTSSAEGFLSRIDQCTAWRGSASSRAWRYLRLWLTMEDDQLDDSTMVKEVHADRLDTTRYFLVTLNRILYWQQWDATPGWLKIWFQVHEVELMIRSLLANDLFIPALQESLQMIKNTTNSVGEVTRKRKLPGVAGEVYLPYLLFDELLKRAEDAPSKKPTSNGTVATFSTSSGEVVERRKLINQVRQAIETHKDHLRKVQSQTIREVNENERRQRQFQQREVEAQENQGEDVAMQ